MWILYSRADFNLVATVSRQNRSFIWSSTVITQMWNLILITTDGITDRQARMYLQLQLRQWVAGNVYLLVLSSWKVNIAENPIAVMGL